MLESEAFTRMRSRVITVFEDGSARVWDPIKSPGQERARGHTGLIYAVAISPDGAQAITCSVDKSLRIWDLTRGIQTRAIENLPAGVWSVSYSRDGTQIAIGLHDNRVQIRSTDDMELITEFKQDAIGWVYAVSFNHDGTKIASTSGVSGGWSLQTEKELLELKGHSDEVTCIDFSPDGSQVMTGAGDKTARLWNAAKGSDSQNSPARRTRELRSL